MANGNFDGLDTAEKTHASAELLAAMGVLLAATREVTLPFDTDEAATARTTRDEIADQLSDYILPRLVQFDAPLLTVIGGSTGAGKSTLVNSIIGEQVTEAGVLRPTTRSPVLAHHPDDAEWFSRDNVLPDLPRSGEGGDSSVYGLRLVATEAVPAGLGILDAPDVDSIDQVNRELATQLLAAADLWLFVTSAARYADQVPWNYLKRAADRATSLAVVLDRTADDAVNEVRGHLARMMTSRGLSDSPLFTIPEATIGQNGLLSAELVAPIANWLRDLASDPKSRRFLVGRTLDGAVRHIVFRTHDVADAMDEQVEIARTLSGAVDDTYKAARKQFDDRSTDGSLLSGEVRTRWIALSNSGPFLAATAPSPGRDQPRHPTELPAVSASLDDAIRALIVDVADIAAENAGAAWATHPAGRALLDAGVSLDRASTEVRVNASKTVASWREFVAARIDEGLDEVSRVDPDLLAVIAVVAVLSPGGADGGAVAGRPALDAALGSAKADSLIADAQRELAERTEKLMGRDRTRLTDVAPGVETIEATQKKLRDAARSAEYARHTDFIHGEIAP